MSIKKSKLFSISLLLLILVIIIVSYFYNNIPNGAIITNNKSNTTSNTNTLTMMYETGPNTGESQVSSDTTWPQEGYVFNDRLSKCENGSELSWDDENKKVIVSTSVSDKCYVYFDVYAPIFSDYIINDIYTEDGVNGLYLHDGAGTYGSLEAGDNSYRYSGANPNNYVCFGSTAATCPNDNLYRIIGVFGDQVKLIKATSIGNYYWYSDWLASNANVWSSSDIVHTLNANFFSTFDNEWQNKISTNSWWVGGGASTQIAYGASSNAKNAYDYEQGINKSNISYSAKIGLLYLNEYYYGAIPTYWSYPGFTMSRYPDANGNYGENFDYRIAINDNWIYSAISEWTITRASDYTGESYVIDETGRIWVTGVNYNKGIRPTFYLNSDVEYAGGTGTQTDPYRIS